MKKTFKYRSTNLIIIYISLLAVLIVWTVPELLDSLTGITYYIANGVISIAIVYFLWFYTDYFPGVNRTGDYNKENGVITLSYGRKTIKLDHVTEIFLSEKRTFSKGVNLVIHNNNQKIAFLSRALKNTESVEDLDLYDLFEEIINENKDLVHEKDIHGNEIKYWYKAK